MKFTFWYRKCSISLHFQPGNSIWLGYLQTTGVHSDFSFSSACRLLIGHLSSGKMVEVFEGNVFVVT